MQSLEQDIIVAFINDVLLIAYINALLSEFRLACLGLGTYNALFVLNLLETIELLTFQLIELGNNIRQSTINAWNDDCN